MRPLGEQPQEEEETSCDSTPNHTREGTAPNLRAVAIRDLGGVVAVARLRSGITTLIRPSHCHRRSLKGVAMQRVYICHASNDIHRHVMDRVAPPRYRLEPPTHGLGQ